MQRKVLNRLELAALLLGGWLLMLPRSDLSAPVQTWKQEEAFDTARACEDAKNEGLSNLLRLKEASIRAGTAGKPAFKKSDDELQRGIDDFRNARCVPAQHIYPPVQPPAPPKQ
jgi:hypothetical protein